MCSGSVDTVPKPCSVCGHPVTVVEGDTCVSAGIVMASQQRAFRLPLTRHPLMDTQLWIEGRLSRRHDIHYGKQMPPYIYLNVVADDGSASRRLFMLAPREAKAIAWSLRRWAGVQDGPQLVPRGLLQAWANCQWAVACLWWSLRRRVRGWLWEEM